MQIKLQHQRREFKLEIQNRFPALASILPYDIDSRGSETAKTIHETVILIASRYNVKSPTNCQLPKLRERHRQMKRNGAPMDNIECSEIGKAIR